MIVYDCVCTLDYLPVMAYCVGMRAMCVRGVLLGVATAVGMGVAVLTTGGTAYSDGGCASGTVAATDNSGSSYCAFEDPGKYRGKRNEDGTVGKSYSKSGSDSAGRDRWSGKTNEGNSYRWDYDPSVGQYVLTWTNVVDDVGGTPNDPKKASKGAKKGGSSKGGSSSSSAPKVMAPDVPGSSPSETSGSQGTFRSHWESWDSDSPTLVVDHE